MPQPAASRDSHDAAATFGSFAALIGKERATVGVIGLGYVGLPLALAFAQSGLKVIGFDVDAKKVQRLNGGQSYIRQIPHSSISAARGLGFEATGQLARLSEPDAVMICVPTPLNDAREPDLTYVVKSSEAVSEVLRAGQLVVLESTTYPTTTRNVVLPILQRSGLAAGKDFFLAYSPEREDPGNPSFSVSSIPKVVGGLDPPSTALACALYASIVPQIVRVSSLEVAEACKILENTYRAVNIALVNELKVLYDRMGIDVWEVIDAARTKPFGFQAFYPGPGLGGHCIPIDPFYLAWLARQQGMSTRFIELAGEVNTSMPDYVISRVADVLNERAKPVKGSRIALLGMAYKKDVDDPRESPGFKLADLLLKKGAVVSYNDPYIPVLPPMRRYPHLNLTSQELTADYLGAQDCVLIVTDHSAYEYPWIVEHSQAVVDTRNATKDVRFGREKITKA